MKLPPITEDPQALVGGSVYDLFGGEDLLRPAAEYVIERDEPMGMRIYFDGIVNDLHAEPRGRFLRIRYKVIREVDVTSLESLLESMRLVKLDLERPFGSPPV
jgi:hypothetical protein